MRQFFKRPPRGLILSLVAVAGAVTAAVFTPTAAADKPLKSEGAFSGSYTLNDTCPFPIDVAYDVTYTEQDYVYKGGAVRVFYHVVEQDTFSTSADTLTGVPFTYNVQLFFPSNGGQTRYDTQGVQQKVPLPDGSLFIAAGQINWLAHPDVPYILLPDNGATVNLDGFCAALEP